MVLKYKDNNADVWTIMRILFVLTKRYRMKHARLREWSGFQSYSLLFNELLNIMFYIMNLP